MAIGAVRHDCSHRVQSAERTHFMQSTRCCSRARYGGLHPSFAKQNAECIYYWMQQLTGAESARFSTRCLTLIDAARRDNKSKRIYFSNLIWWPPTHADTAFEIINSIADIQFTKEHSYNAFALHADANCGQTRQRTSV